MKDNIALIGFVWEVKSTIGRVLAKYLDMKFIDIDKWSLQEKNNLAEIFEERRSYFRKLEREIVYENL